jgi:uncharacterized membrane protein
MVERDDMQDTPTQTTGASESVITLVGAAGLGAALMYFLDPDRGARRRHLVRDRFVHARVRTADALGSTTRDLRNRTRGLAAEARSRLKRDAADDDVIAARVRSEIGRVVSHPSSILVSADQGHVTLGGPVLAGEVDRLLSAARGVRGVRDIENRLEVHESAEGVPGLQGGQERIGERPELAQENWAPAARLLTGAVGSALAIYGARRRDALGAALGLAGLALATRGATNRPAKRLAGVAGRRAIDVRKTITVNAPVGRVFGFFSQWENWPRWMSHVREVRHAGTVGGDARTHWVVDGPAGVPIEWDALTTKLVPNEEIAWKTVEGSAVEHAGVIRFLPAADGATTVDIRMSYNPPAGAVGHTVAALLGRDPKHQMDDDLARLKTTIETGIPPHDAAQRTARAEARRTLSPSPEPREAPEATA